MRKDQRSELSTQEDSLNLSTFKNGAVVALMLGTSSILGACTKTERAIFPEVGEYTPLRDSVVCANFGVDGEPTGDTQYFRVIEVGSKDAGYKYYSFGVDGNSAPEPMIFSLHKTGVKDAYLGQAVAPDGYHYFWYDLKSNTVFYMENGLMNAEVLALAEKHNVALETKSQQYYQTVHGSDKNIKNFLLAYYSTVFQGGGMRCQPE